MGRVLITWRLGLQCREHIIIMLSFTWACRVRNMICYVKSFACLKMSSSVQALENLVFLEHMQFFDKQSICLRVWRALAVYNHRNTRLPSRLYCFLTSRVCARCFKDVKQWGTMVLTSCPSRNQLRSFVCFEHRRARCTALGACFCSWNKTLHTLTS